MRKFTLLIASLFITIGAMAENYKVGQAVTDVTTGYYVVVGTFNTNTTGPVYYDNAQNRKYRLDIAKTIDANSTLTDGNYVWYVENNGTTITLRNVQDNVYFVKDAAKNNNFNGTETANLILEKVVEDANDKRYYLHLEDQNIGYIHCNQPGGNPNLSYWDAVGENGTCVRFEFYAIAEVFVSSLSDFKQDKAYTITCDRGAWVVDGTFKTSKDAGVSADATNANQQFAVLTLDNNDYYLYSVGGKGFVKSDGTIANAGDPIQLNDASSQATGCVQIQFKGTSTYVNMGGSNQTALDDWSTVDAGNAVKFLEVTEFADTEEALMMLAKGLLGEAVAEYDAKSAISGEGLGKFSCTLEGYETEVEEIKAYYQNIPETATKDEIFAKVTRLGEIIDAFTLNMPKAGSYIRVAYDYGGTNGTLYMQGETSQNSANKPGVKFTNETGAASIWYYDGTSLISYTKGVCIAEAGDTRGLQDIGATQQVTFSACDRAPGKYFVKVPHYIHANTAGTEHFSDHCPNDNNRCAEHCLILEDVTELPVAVTAAGYATLYAPVALTVPTGVTAHTVTLNGEWATLSEALTTIPANTGVVLVGEGSHSFAITTADAFNGTNALLGSVATTYYTEAGTYYALAQVDGVVGFYKDQFNNSRFQNNSHKAYLYVAEGSANVASYSFRFGEGTTGIDEVKGENGNVKTIYDLTGRRVEAITAPGIYIVGGKKVLVK